MKRLTPSIDALLVALAVVALAAAVALARSHGLTLALVPDTPVAIASEEAISFDLGERVWMDRCYGCHAELDYVPDLFVAPGGRDYLLDFMLVGVHGEAVIYGELQTLRHRSYAELGDDELAAVLNYMLVAPEGESPLTVAPPYDDEEVAAARLRRLGGDEVLDARPQPSE